MAISVSGKLFGSGVKMYKSSVFTPESFWAGQTGGFWNFSSGANLYSDLGRTTPASVDGIVRGVTDLSGLGNHLIGANDSLSYGFTMKSGYCLADQGGAMITSAGQACLNYTAFALVRTPSSFTATENIVDTDYGPSYRVSQNIIISSSGQQQSYIFGYFTPFVTKSTPTLSTETNYFLATAVDGTDAILRGSGSSYSPGTGGGPISGGFPLPVAIGASFGGTVSPQFQDFTGRIYCAAWINKKCTEQEIIDVGNYMVSLTGQSATV